MELHHLKSAHSVSVAPGADPAAEGTIVSLDGPQMSDRDFERVSAFVHERTGIAMTRVKKTMLQARLQKRLRALGLHSFSEYCTFLFSGEGQEQEIVPFINVVTTNKTDFFREPHHFEYLAGTALPRLEHEGLLRQRRLRVWSAACSSGQEPYTLAMVLAGCEERIPGLSWSVLGTDISTKVLDIATAAVYPEEEVEPVPLPLRKKYLLRSKDRSRGLVKIVPALQEKVTLRRLNLMEEEYGLQSAFEIIFCRNVIIYFDKPTQVALLRRLLRHLVPGGFLFLGHSESLNGIPLPCETVGTTIYRKTQGAA